MCKKVIKMGLILSLFALNGCKDGSNSAHEKNITESNKIKLNDTKSNNQKDLSSKIGISAKDGKIVIEPKKTKKFLDDIAKVFEKKAKELKENTKNINENDIGVNINKEKITIDLNKTKNFLEKFSKELENVAKEIDKAVNQ